MSGEPRPQEKRSQPSERGRPISRTGSMILLVALFAATLPAVTADEHPDWPAVEPVRLLGDLEMPTDIDVAADGSVWFTELAGNVSRLDPGSGASERVHEVPNVVTGRERGLVGMALAHDHAETGAFYLYYSERVEEDPDGGMNRLVRVVDGEETRLASLTAALEHNGGRIVVAPNGTLFVGTGENSKHDPAQDLDSLLGKVLHLTPEGDPVPGNLKGLVYSYGHRNVYGLALDPETEALWATENMGWRRDEVNIIEPGGNYGYPECEGNGRHGIDDPCPTDKGYIFPVKTYYEDRAVAPTGAVFFHDGFHWASFNEGSIHHLWQDDASGEWLDEIVYEHGAPILDLVVATDGTFYLSAVDSIWRLDFPQVAADPPETPSDEETDGDVEPRGAIPGPAVILLVLFVVSWSGVLRRWGRRKR